MPIRILVADDNPADIILLREGLNATKLTYVMDHVLDGERIIERLTKSDETVKPDLLILDLHLPRLSGAGVVEAVRARKIMIPILILTSVPSERDREKLTALGVQLLLDKPGSLAGYYELGRKIEDFCRTAFPA